MAGFMYPGLLSDWTDSMEPQDPRMMPQGLLAALSQAQGGAPMSNTPTMQGAQSPMPSGGFQPMQTAQPVDDPFGGDPRFNKQPAPQGGMPMPAIPSAINPVPSFQQQPDTEQKYGYLDGSQAFKDYANKPAPGAAQAGGAPMPQDGKDQPGFLDKLTGVLGGVYGQGGPGDGLINLGLALMSPGNKAENLMRAGQMGQMADYKKSQLLAAQMKQQRETLALQGNMQTLKQAYPNWSQEQLAAAAQNPSLVQEAVKSINPSDVTRPLVDAGERAKYGIGADNKNVYQIDRNGKITAVGTPTTTVNIDQKGESSFAQTAGSDQAKRFAGYIGGADKAQAAMGDINNLREISKRMGSQGSSADFKRMIGPYAEAAGVNIEGLPDIQAYNSIIQKLAPQMHAPGSGSTSDIEFKGMLSALPQLSANPAAREAILNTMEAHQRYAMKQGEIAASVINGDLTRQEAEKQLRALPDPMTAFREFQKGGATGTAAPDASGWTTVNGYRVRKVN